MCGLGGVFLITFIHAADLHLDTPFKGLEQTSKKMAAKLQVAPYESFTKIIDLALEKAVDFVVLSGDLYNTQRVNIKSQSKFIAELDRLNEVDIPVFMIRGNHDYLTKETAQFSLPLPENTYTFSADVSTHIIETINKKRIAVSGFSYDSQWISKRKIKEYPMRKQNVDMHIGLLHGSAEGIHSDQGNYAPFAVAELREKKYDYWALGHIHLRQQISDHPLAYYPGNIQGLHKNEIGPKGCLYITWEAREHQVEFIPTAPVIWDNVELDISGIMNLGDLLECIQKEIQDRSYQTTVLLNMTLTATDQYHEKLVELIQHRDFNRQLTTQLNQANLWITKVEFILNDQSDQQSLDHLYPEIWQNIVTEAHQSQAFNQMTDGILQQSISKYLTESNTEVYRQEMIKKAIAKIYLK